MFSGAFLEKPVFHFRLSEASFIISPVATGDMCPVATGDIFPVAAGDMPPVLKIRGKTSEWSDLGPKFSLGGMTTIDYHQNDWNLDPDTVQGFPD